MTEPPNIVFIMTDQQRLDTIAANGFAHMITPHLDDLVTQGAVFENMYVTSPSCAPSRASIFSGTYPHTNGVFRNDEKWHYCWVKELSRSGYRCVNVGKMHTNPFEGSFGFHERHVVENKDRDTPNLPFFLDNWDKALRARRAYKPSRVTYARRPDYPEKLGTFVWDQDEDLHPDVFVGNTACWWLDRYPGNEPFFLQIGFPGPHPPYDPTQEYLEKYKDRDLPKPILDYDLETQPIPLRKLRKNHLEMGHDAVVHLASPSEEQLHLQRAHYYANVSMIDTQVGKIIESLKSRGVYENTVIIFTTDHGDCLNDHGHSQKWNMYEQSVHVPGIIFWPDHIDAGTRINDFVSSMDLGPTILEIAGVEVPEWMEAQSLTDALSGKGPDTRKCLFAEHSNDKILTGTKFMTMVLKDSWKMVHFVDHAEGQLFDLKSDPGERINLWNDKSHEHQRLELLDEMLRWRLESSWQTQGFLQMLAFNNFE